MKLKPAKSVLDTKTKGQLIDQRLWCDFLKTGEFKTAEFQRLGRQLAVVPVIHRVVSGLSVRGSVGGTKTWSHYASTQPSPPVFLHRNPVTNGGVPRP